jgi:8-hydroxy-5-deazaflavin:NADPH oxidoreductase
MNDITFGILGAGNIGKALAAHLTKAGYQVTISNSRGADSLTSLITELGSNAKAGSAKEAAEQDIVILALPWAQLPTVLPSLTNWKDRMVVDVSNHFISFDPFKLADLGGKTSSEVVAGFVPGAKLIKAFNTLNFQILGSDPSQASGHRVIFLSGDHGEAKKKLKEAITRMGFAPIDLGGLVAGGRLQQPDGPLSNQNLVKLS